MWSSKQIKFILNQNLRMYAGNKSGKVSGRNARAEGGGSDYFNKNYLRNKEEVNSPGIKYVCPNRCEGSKFYTEQTVCPVCRLRLFPLGAESIFY